MEILSVSNLELSSFNQLLKMNKSKSSNELINNNQVIDSKDKGLKNLSKRLINYNLSGSSLSSGYSSGNSSIYSIDKNNNLDNNGVELKTFKIKRSIVIDDKIIPNEHESFGEDHSDINGREILQKKNLKLNDYDKELTRLAQPNPEVAYQIFFNSKSLNLPLRRIVSDLCLSRSYNASIESKQVNFYYDDFDCENFVHDDKGFLNNEENINDNIYELVRLIKEYRFKEDLIKCNKIAKKFTQIQLKLFELIKIEDLIKILLENQIQVKNSLLPLIEFNLLIKKIISRQILDERCERLRSEQIIILITLAKKLFGENKDLISTQTILNVLQNVSIVKLTKEWRRVRLNKYIFK